MKVINIKNYQNNNKDSEDIKTLLEDLEDLKHDYRTTRREMQTEVANKESDVILLSVIGGVLLSIGIFAPNIELASRLIGISFVLLFMFLLVKPMWDLRNQAKDLADYCTQGLKEIDELIKMGEF